MGDPQSKKGPIKKGGALGTRGGDQKFGGKKKINLQGGVRKNIIASGNHF